MCEEYIANIRVPFTSAGLFYNFTPSGIQEVVWTSGPSPGTFSQQLCMLQWKGFSCLHTGQLVKLVTEAIVTHHFTAMAPHCM